MIKYKEIAVNVSKKIGQPEFGSIMLSASVTMECDEIEVDKAFDVGYKRCWDEIEQQEKELIFRNEVKEVTSPSVTTPTQPKVVDPIMDVTAPQCPIHKTPFKWVPAGVSKSGKAYAGFYSCPGKNPDGSFCKQKPQ